MAGAVLRDLVTGSGEQLLGRHFPQPRFPLLLKYLDADKRLSIQVHPDDKVAAKLGLTDPGKIEAWYVIHADPGSSVWVWFSPAGDSGCYSCGNSRG